MQPERDHNFDGENTRYGEGYMRKYRFAYENGWYGFDMKCNHNSEAQLLLTYFGGDTRKYCFTVEIGDWKKEVNLNSTQDGFVEHILDIPHEVIKDKEKVRVVFKADEKNRVSNIYDCRLMKK